MPKKLIYSLLHIECCYSNCVHQKSVHASKKKCLLAMKTPSNTIKNKSKQTQGFYLFNNTKVFSKKHQVLFSKPLNTVCTTLGGKQNVNIFFVVQHKINELQTTWNCMYFPIEHFPQQNYAFLQSNLLMFTYFISELITLSSKAKNSTNSYYIINKYWITLKTINILQWSQNKMPLNPANITSV